MSGPGRLCPAHVWDHVPTGNQPAAKQGDEVRVPGPRAGWSVFPSALLRFWFCSVGGSRRGREGARGPWLPARQLLLRAGTMKAQKKEQSGSGDRAESKVGAAPAWGAQLASTQGLKSRLQSHTCLPSASTRQPLATAPGPCVGWTPRSPGASTGTEVEQREGSRLAQAASSHQAGTAEHPWAQQPLASCSGSARRAQLPGGDRTGVRSTRMEHNLVPGSLRLPCAKGLCLGPLGLHPRGEAVASAAAWHGGSGGSGPHTAPFPGRKASGEGTSPCQSNMPARPADTAPSGAGPLEVMRALLLPEPRPQACVA